MMAPPPQPKKPAVPEWLRQEMLKRANAGADATGTSRSLYIEYRTIPRSSCS